MEIKGVCNEIQSNGGKTVSVGRKKGKEVLLEIHRICVCTYIYIHIYAYTHIVLVIYINFITSPSYEDNIC